MNKSYLTYREEDKARYLAYHETIWEELGFTGPWGHLRDESTFNRFHSTIVQAVAKHGPFDATIDYARLAWTGAVRIVRVPGSARGFKVACADSFHIDKAAIIEDIIGAVIAIGLTLAFPPLALVAGFLGTCIVGLALLVLANMAANFVNSRLCGVADVQPELDRLAAEALAA